MSINLKEGNSSKVLKFLIIAVLVIGIVLRFVNIDRKVYWGDEVMTSVRISGYTFKEIKQDTFKDRVITIQDLQKFQKINPEKDVTDTIGGVAREEPQLSPLYFLILRFWAEFFGDSVGSIRTFSASISLFVFPCIYWLCLELFESSLVGWIGMALIAVSPFHILYAQEARMYSFWTVTVLLSSAALLRAMRLNGRLSWVIYSISLSLGLYVYLLSGLVSISHGIYVLTIEGFRFGKKIIAYLVASCAALVSFIPWIYAIAVNFQKASNTTDWSGKGIDILSLVKTWLLNLARLFIDLNFGANKLAVCLFFVLVPLVLYSIYFVVYRASRKACIFILSLIGVTAIALILPDLFLGGRRSTVARYLIPFYLGIELAVAYMLSSNIFDDFERDLHSNRQEIIGWNMVMIGVILSGLISSGITSRSQYSWNKYQFANLVPISVIINRSDRPLVIGESVDIPLSLSYLVEPKVQFYLLSQSDIMKIDDNFQDVFILSPSQTLQKRLKQNKSKIEPVYSDYRLSLWQLKR